MKLKKLELTWPNKNQMNPIEPRILLSENKYSHGVKNSGNALIQGDNLLALKALEQDYTGKIKAVFIDPPYNTGNAFAHYDDGLEHSIWMNLMKPRLESIKNLLSEDGSLWISIDDQECHYLKVMCDEVFGRNNFINTVIWHKKHTRSNDARWLSDNHDFILIYAKDKNGWKRNLLPREKSEVKGYTNPDNDPRGVWASGPCHAKTPSEKTFFEVITPSGRKILPPAGTSWRFNKKRFQELIDDNRIWFGKDGNNVPRFKRFLTDVQDGLVPTTIWFKDEVGDNQEAKKEVKAFNAQDVFSTPKPERLLKRILTIATNEGDYVLDSFLGSGTTVAVAHKMKRKWIGIELGDHCISHCLPRLKSVIDGNDTGGISKSVDWKSGGGFDFYKLAPSLLNKDQYDNWVISKEYNANMLAAAVAKQEGFSYQPNKDSYWKQGFSSEQDFIYTTTRFVTVELLDQLHDQLQEGESLLICAKKFQPECDNRFGNITLKKIPLMLLGKCEFAKNDYSLNIINLPEEDDYQTEED